MEEVIFPKPEITALLKETVRARLYTDDSEHLERNERYTKVQQDRFQTVALPFYAIISPDDKVLATFPGMTRDTAEFAAFIKSGLEAQQGK